MGPTEDYPLSSYSEYRIAMSIQNARPYIFSPIGILSNMLSLFILTKKRLHTASITPYLLTIAICDSVYLITDLLDIPIGKLIVKTHSFCTVVYFLSYITTFTSDAIVAAVAVDRALVISVPHKAHLFSTPRKTKLVIFSALIFEVFVSAECFFTYTVDPTGKYCIRTGRQSIRQAAALIILVHNLIAWFIIFISSCIILNRLRMHRRMLEQLEMPMPPSSQKENQIGLMLISIAVLYIFTNLPTVCVLLSAHFTSWYTQSNYHTALFTLIYEISLVCKSVNHFLNFYLYCASATLFREEVIKFFRHCLPKRFRQKPPQGTPNQTSRSLSMSSRVTNATVYG